MTNRATILNNTLAVLRAAGLTPEVQQGGKHLHVRCKNRLDKSCLIIISRGGRTPNQRAIHENRATLRRLLRAPTSEWAS
jgi:hypothetical protein